MENITTTTDTSMVEYGFGKTLSAPFQQAIERITEALKGEGFGVLTTIDVQATMKAKLDVDVEPYTILGACNPNIAHKAIGIEPHVGLLLPCNVVVRQVQPDASGQAQVLVEIADPQAMLGIVGNSDMNDIAQEARARLQRALAAL